MHLHRTYASSASCLSLAFLRLNMLAVWKLLPCRAVPGKQSWKLHGYVITFPVLIITMSQNFVNVFRTTSELGKQYERWHSEKSRILSRKGGRNFTVGSWQLQNIGSNQREFSKQKCVGINWITVRVLRTSDPVISHTFLVLICLYRR